MDRGSAASLVGRAVADEAELLTLAVPPARRRRRQRAARLLARFEAEAARAGARRRAFLEVAADNTAARALYRSRGLAETGRRAAYYRARRRRAVDALILSKPLPAA